MNLRKIIVHEIQKNPGENETEITLSDELIPNDNQSSSLVSTLLRSYRGDKILYAVFEDEEGHYFPERYNTYKETNRSNDDFIDFTHATLNNLNARMRGVTLATGGYFLFAEYESSGSDFIAIFLIRDREGKILRKTENSYEIKSIEYLDTNNLAMACRLNETKYLDNDINYLNFTQLKQSTVSSYFLEWISVKQLESSGDYTKSLYSIVSAIEPPINGETNERFTTEQFRDKVYNFVSNSPNRKVNLHELGSHFYDDNERLTNYAEENDILIDTEFRYSKAALRRFVKIRIQKDGINLNFSRGALDDKVRVSNENVNIVIIESEAVANALRSEINNG